MPNIKLSTEHTKDDDDLINLNENEGSIFFSLLFTNVYTEIFVAPTMSRQLIAIVTIKIYIYYIWLYTYVR